MNPFRRPIVVTPHGVHQPPLWWLEAAALLLGALLPIALAAAGRLSWTGASIALLYTVGIFGVRLFQFGRHGALGAAEVSVQHGTLRMAAPLKGRDGLSVPLDQLQRVIVYGAANGRLVRVERRDGGFEDVRPQWQPGLERQAIDFLRRVLPGRVVVEAPQTAFAVARGDGPALED